MSYTQEKVEVSVINGVKSLKLCFGIHCTLTPGHESSDYEERYERIYKPLISALYTLPELAFTISMSGNFIEWMERHHAEFFMILNEMIARKQIEVIGGGYYTPLFPLIPPADRVGQIELMTTSLRKVFGKRPRGAWLPASAWDPSMISSLTTCGIEYVLIDRIMLKMSGFQDVDGYAPVTLEDGGKTVTALPLDNQYRNLERFSPASFIGEMRASLEDGRDRVLVIFIEEDSIPALFTIEDGSPSWFGALLAHVGENSEIELCNTGKILKNRILYRRACVSPGMSPFDIEDAALQDDIRILSRTSVKRYLVNSPDIMNLYAKMMYVHTLVNQLRGDKARKNNAREDLWKAQNSEVFLPHSRKDPCHFRKLCMLAYKNLLLAEKTSRIRGIFASSVNAFDFDMDGLKEYLCQLDSLNIYVHPEGGRIFELDVLEANRNYCDIGDASTGLFIDHFVSTDDVEQLASDGSLLESPVFSSSLYQEISVDPARHEIQLRASGFYGSFQQPLTLRKQYNFRNEGIQVQYILKNESPFNLSGIFMIELDLAVTGLRNKTPLMTVYACDSRKDSMIERARYDDVEWIQVTDSDNGVKFTVEPNENTSFMTIPVTDDVTCGVRLFLYWKTDLGANYETEKTVFLKIDSQ